MPYTLIAVAVVTLATVAWVWRTRWLHHRFDVGDAQTVSCWLRGSAPPYPGVPYPGRLSVTLGGPVRFVMRLGRVRELVLPVGGLRLITVRPVGAGDPIHATGHDRERLVALVCRDALGAAVDVFVPEHSRAAAELVLTSTAGAAGPAMIVVRRIGRLQALAGRWVVIFVLSLTVPIAVVQWLRGDLSVVAFIGAYAVGLFALLSILRYRSLIAKERTILGWQQPGQIAASVSETPATAGTATPPTTASVSEPVSRAACCVRSTSARTIAC